MSLRAQTRATLLSSPLPLCLETFFFLLLLREEEKKKEEAQIISDLCASSGASSASKCVLRVCAGMMRVCECMRVSVCV